MFFVLGITLLFCFVLFYLYFFNFLIEVYLIYNLVLGSGVQQSDSVMHTYILSSQKSFLISSAPAEDLPFQVC